MGLFPVRSLELKNGNREALLVLTGIGYGFSGMRSMKKFRKQAPDLDLFVPDYIQNSGIDDSVRFLESYYNRNDLHRYDRVHLFCFIAGAYVLERWMDQIPNAGRLLLDRSPYQERAPSIVTRRIPWVARLLLGDFVFQLAAREYPQKPLSRFKPGLVIESRPTTLMKLFSRDCKKMGPLKWPAREMQDEFADFQYVPFNHDSIYSNFHTLAQSIRAFLQSGNFGEVYRNPPGTTDEASHT